MVESSVTEAFVCGSVSTISLAVILPPVWLAGLVVVMERSPSIFELPETSNLAVGDLPIPKLPDASSTAWSVPVLSVKCKPIPATPF